MKILVDTSYKITSNLGMRYIKTIQGIDPDIFWSAVKIGEPNVCWEWQNGRTGKNYGYVCLRKAESKRSKRMLLAHRISWTLTNGEIPDRMWILHKCDNPPCCNPAHLFLGTCADNVADMIKKGRNARGEKSGTRLHPEIIMHGTKHPLAKLTDEKVREIRKKRKTGATFKTLGIEYGVHFSKIAAIIYGWSWKHVI